MAAPSSSHTRVDLMKKIGQFSIIINLLKRLYNSGIPSVWPGCASVAPSFAVCRLQHGSRGGSRPGHSQGQKLLPPPPLRFSAPSRFHPQILLKFPNFSSLERPPHFNSTLPLEVPCSVTTFFLVVSFLHYFFLCK